MARKAIPRLYSVRMTRATKVMLKTVAKQERRTQGDMIDHLLRLHLDKVANVQRT